jgi:hypothetical protein
LTKNKKVVIASVGVLIVLIASVLSIRNPGQRIVQAPDPPKQTITQTPQPASPTPKESPVSNSSHDKVTKVIDDASKAVVNKAPGLWAKVVDAGKWFMGFDTKHALILIGVCIVFVSIISGGKNKNKSR